MRIITVSPDGKAEFRTLSQAVDAVPEQGAVIEIGEGVYREKIFIEKNNVRLIGRNPDKTVIIYDDHALKTDDEGKQYGTFRSWTLKVLADDFFMENITVENDAGSGSVVGQAVALSVTGDRCRFSNCHFTAHQDTLFTGPGNIDENGGPGDFARRMLFEKCVITGDVDFIFGSATAYFRECVIISRNRNMSPNGYITANSTNNEIKYGYVFKSCKLIGEQGIQDESVFLGRPWRKHSAAVFINCEMGAHISPEGWDNWRNPENEKTVRYGEHGSSGQGKAPERRVKWTRQLGSSEIEEYTTCNMFDDWKI